jgi:hypothetical protein
MTDAEKLWGEVSFDHLVGEGEHTTAHAITLLIGLVMTIFPRNSGHH